MILSIKSSAGVGPRDADSGKVGGSLLMGRDGMRVATFRDVVLHLGRIGGILDMISSHRRARRCCPARWLCRGPRTG